MSHETPLLMVVVPGRSDIRVAQQIDPDNNLFFEK